MSHMKAKFETSASSHGRKRVGAPKPKNPSAPAKLPHITKLMALAIRLEHLLATGQVKDQAEIARVAGITRGSDRGQTLPQTGVRPCLRFLKIA